MCAFDDILNKEITIKEFAIHFGTYGNDIYNGMVAAANIHKECFPDSYSSGRTNYIMFQKAICELSNGYVEYGGQGKNKADCYIDGKPCETKAYDPKEKKHFIASSCLFANNGKVREWKDLKKNSQEAARELLFKLSYEKNDFYCLTQTKNCTTQFEDVKILFLEREKLTQFLLKEDERYLDLDALHKLLSQQGN